MPAPDTCPNCGALVPSRANSCPECGSDDSTGWSERATGQSLGLLDDEFDYEEFTKREFGPPKRRPVKLLWWLVAIGLLIFFVIALLPK